MKKSLILLPLALFALSIAACNNGNNQNNNSNNQSQTQPQAYKDKTIANNKIPYTGSQTVVFISIALVIPLGIIFYKKYRNLSEI